MALIDLIRPRWKHSDYAVRFNAVARLTDQATLAEVAKNDNEPELRMNAAQKLTDQAMAQAIYVEVATTAKQHQRTRAISLLTDQSTLVKVARNDSAPELRLAAAQKLTDQAMAQAIYTEIVKTDLAHWKGDYCVMRDVQRSAIEKLTDQAVLAEVAQSDPSLREAAAERLTDRVLAQSFLAQIVKAASNNKGSAHWIPSAGVSYGPTLAKITDQAILADVAKNAVDEDLRLAAAERITDRALAQSVYAQIAMTATVRSTEKNVCMLANITEQVILADIAKNTMSFDVSLLACARITDQAVLVDIAKCPGSRSASLAAAERVTSQILLADIVKNAVDHSVRVAAVKRITKSALREPLLEDLFWSLLMATEVPPVHWSNVGLLCDFAEQFPHRHFADVLRDVIPQAPMKALCYTACQDDLFTSNDARRDIKGAQEFLRRIGRGRAEKDAMHALVRKYGGVSQLSGNLARRLATIDGWDIGLSPSERAYVESAKHYHSNIANHLEH